MSIELEQYQQNLFTQLIIWTNRILFAGILINFIWFFIDFWPTIFQVVLSVFLVLIGLWCKSQIPKNRYKIAARIFIAVGMLVMAAIIPTLGPFFALIGAIGLNFYIFIGILIVPSRKSHYWGAIGAALYLISFTVLLLWPIYEMPFHESDIFGLYVFPIIGFVGFTYLGHNAIDNIKQALEHSHEANLELEKSNKALSNSQEALFNANDALQHELQERLQIEQELRNYQHHLEEMVADRTARLEALHEFDTAILEAELFPDLADAVLSHIGQLVPCDFAWVTVLDHEKETIRILGRDLLDNSSPDSVVHRPISVVNEFESYQQGFDLERSNIGELTTLFHNDEKLLSGGICSSYDTPVIIQGELVAIISIGNKTPLELTPENKTIIKEVSRSLALSLQQINLQKSIKTHMADLEISLKEKETLFREVHHRVKNNLQIISSILHLQQGHDTEPKIHELLVENQNRIRAIALVHEKMYRSGNLSQINLGNFIHEHVSGLISIYKTDNANLKLDIQAEDVLIHIDTAIPLGLILNELVTNSFKHAFPDQILGEIEVKLSAPQANQVQLCVLDNGIGFQYDFNKQASKSLGLQLIQQLVNQIGASLKLSSEIGTQAIVTINI